MVRFSDTFRSFASWLRAMPRESRYAQEIIRKHYWAPEKSLMELREASLSNLDPTKQPWKSLTPNGKDMRNRMSLVFSDRRAGDSLSQAAKNQGLSLREVLRYGSSYIYKKNGRYYVVAYDSMERGRWMYSEGKRISLVVTNSKDASILSKYLSKVKKALNTGNEEILKPFKGKFIKDADGKKHYFETDLETLYELEEKIEDREGLPIYDDRI